MARVVLGIGTSHTPLLTLDSSEWHNRASNDRANKRLGLADGRLVDYETLVELRGEPYGSAATLGNFAEQEARCQAYLDRLADAIEAADPDVIVVVGDDQSELYVPGNMPAIALYYGDEIITHTFDEDMPQWMKPVAKGYGMDHSHIYPGRPDLARHIIDGLISRDVDLAIANKVPDPKSMGFGHAFGFPAERLFKGRQIPMVPVLLNTYYPPNVLTPSRCYAVGEKLRAAIEDSPLDLRVAVLASGGLSHVVVEEAIDRQVMSGLSEQDGGALAGLPREALIEGTSEILNWVVAAASVRHLPLAWSAYEPIRRTPAGTGIGCAFAIWSEPNHEQA